MKKYQYASPTSIDNRQIVRSDSRPTGYLTNFTTRGDSLTGLGDGKVIEWDFSDTNDDITAPAGFKRKRLEMGFSEPIYIKEGTIYFYNSPKGAYMDFYIVCKTGAYYVDPNGLIPASALGLTGLDMYTQAVADTPQVHYVNHHNIVGDVPMGDELNTEGASESALPTQQTGYVLWIEITTPDTDSSSYGSTELEIYRPRTVLLPGEVL